MSAKQILTKKFGEQKRLFSIHDELDNFIKPFILQLNEHPDIVTYYSCEGNDIGDNTHHSLWAYFSLNISERYWGYFWSNVVPDLILTIDVKISTNCFNETIFFHAISEEQKYKFWNTIFKVFKKHGLIKDLVYEKD